MSNHRIRDSGLRRLVYIVLSLLIPPAAVALANTWYVDDDAPDDPGPGDPTVSYPNEDGSEAHPFDAIRQAIDAALTGDTVEILGGSYNTPGNRVFLVLKHITITGVDGAKSTFIACERSADSPQGGFGIVGGSGDLITEGLTISNSYVNSSGGGTSSWAATPTVRKCRSEKCTAAAGGARALWTLPTTVPWRSALPVSIRL